MKTANVKPPQHLAQKIASSRFRFEGRRHQMVVTVRSLPGIEARSRTEGSKANDSGD